MNMIKRIIAIAVTAAAFLPIMAQKAAENNEYQVSPQQKLNFAEQVIERFYVEEVDGDTIVTEAIKAMLKTLDPHSSYSSPEETKELSEPLEGKFSGIGIQFNMSTDTVYVIQTISGGPSEKVGIRPGDRIIMADDSVIAGKKLPNSAVMKMLRGEKGSQVRLGVKRGKEPELIEFIVTRDDIPLNSVDGVYMASPEVGYIRLTRFAESSAEEVEKAIHQLKAQGMKSLILDLQGNGGGYLGSAFGIASMFLENGDMVVYTQGRNSEPQYMRVRETAPLFDGPVAVLIDQYSASASEIVAGALQDNDRAIIVGRRSFGKGLVQRPFQLPDGSMIRLTVSRYYTPSGRCIQKPYDKGHSEEYRLDLLNRYESGELWSADSIHFDENQKFSTLKKGRTVYGGGGIMPDEFVPVDTSYYSPLYRNIVAKSILPLYTLGYVDDNRETLMKKYPTEDDFFNDFNVTEDMIGQIIAKAKDEDIEIVEEELETSRPLIKAIVKGQLANDLYKNGNYIRAVNGFNPTYVRALEIISDK